MVTALMAFALIVLTAAVNVRAQQFKAVRQLTSNNIIALAGSGDTLWMATERGFNYRVSANAAGGWLGFEVNDLAKRFWNLGLGFGGGRAVALINKDNQSDSIGFWQFNHNDNRQQHKYFKFSPGVHGDSALPVGSVVYSNGSFWAPFYYGGLVRYDPDPVNNAVYAIRPMDGNESTPQNIEAMSDEDAGTKTVLSIDVNRLDSSSIIVTSPKTLWRYRPANKQWESIDTSPVLVGTNDEFVSFDAAFTIRKKDAAALYSFITIKRGDAKRTVLYAFDSTGETSKWHAVIDDGKSYSVFPAVNGCIYALSGNRVGVYADTASVGRGGALLEVTKPNDFLAMLSPNNEYHPDPEVKDILFLPKTDSSGALAVATETGLYVWESAEPLSNKYDGFKLYRYVRPVGSGEAYALPGIIRGGAGDNKYEKCVFVYNLKNDGDVTIRVYDYNMSLVKTVVKGERRRAGENRASGRSTEPSRDFWDGTNGRGKRVWPGVYYFKITSGGGERLFGKVILAK